MALHQCAECGLTHDHEGSLPVSPEVEIARINAERDVKVAELARRQELDWNETRVAETEIEAEAAVDIAEVQAESGVEAAEAVADALAPPEPEPIQVEVTDPGPVEEEMTIEPAGEGSPVPSVPQKSTWSYW
jgi:hypothetical protein